VVDGEAAGAGDAGAESLDGEVAGGWVPARDSLAAGVGVLAGWLGPAVPQAATSDVAASDVATTAPASHPTRGGRAGKHLDMACSFRRQS
jgi:hypothetical protein